MPDDTRQKRMINKDIRSYDSYGPGRLRVFPNLSAPSVSVGATRWEAHADDPERR